MRFKAIILVLFLSSCSVNNYKIANRLDSEGNFDKAIKYYSKYIKSNKNPYVYFNRSLTYQKAGKYKRAIKDLKTADTLLNIKRYKTFGSEIFNDTSHFIYIEYKNSINNNLGNCYYKIQDYYKALEYFKKSLKINPEAKEINYNIGLTYYDLHQLDSSFYYLNKQIKINPNHSESYFILSLLYNEFGDFEKAVRMCRSGLKLSEDPSAYYNLGLFYNKLNQPDSAILYLSKSLKMDSNSPLCFLERGKAFGMTGMYKNSIKDCYNGLQLDSTISDLYYILGLAYFKSENIDSACYYFRKEKQLFPESDVDVNFPNCWR